VKAKKASISLVILFTLVSLSGCTLDSITAQQAEATGLWEELTGLETYGQSFVSSSDNLFRIDLSTATYARTNSAPVVFHLQSRPGQDSDLRTVTIPGPEIENERPTSFEFPPLPDSEGQAYYFYVESPEATPGNAITVYANADDLYPDGSAYRNGAPVPGDLAFKAYSQTSFTLSGILGGFLSRAGQDVPFFVCYGVLILGACAGLVCALRHGGPFSREEG
jgi:hypothetical protein